MTAAVAAVTVALAELETRPPSEWPGLLRARFPGDPALAGQLLLWLESQRAQRAQHTLTGREPTSALGASTRYALAAQLGAGATATVWRAYDHKLRRDVAIKVFDGAAPAIDEILGEARAASEITSEHVVRVLDVHDDEPAYIVMELVGEHDPRGTLAPGASAAALRPRDLWEAVRWVRDVARGVHDAHLRNVFHRDLKPHNVLITPISRRAKVADFGLALSSHGRAGAEPRPLVELAIGRSALGIAGTPGYMAPEQARGLSLALDPHDPGDRATLIGVDVWGLGALAHDLLAGQPPWQAAGALEAWELAASGARPAPLTRTSSGERIPERLRRIAARALADAPADRYASAAELADELHAVLACRPTSFDRSPTRRTALWARRNPQLTLTAAAAVVLAAMSLATYATVLHLRDERAALTAEVASALADKTRLASQASAAQRELSDTDASLHTLQHSLASVRDEYRAIVVAREDALRSASLATRALAVARDDRDVADKTRALYEAFWERARSDAEDAAHDRDKAIEERDAAKAAADQAIKDRDDARAARARAEHDRDDARAARDRDAAARRQAEAELAQVIGELSALVGPDHAKRPDEHEAGPVKPEAVKAEPSKPDPAKAEPAKPSSTKVDPAKPSTAKLDVAKAEPTKAEPAKAEATKAEPIKAEVPKPDPAKPDPAKADSARADPAKPAAH